MTPYLTGAASASPPPTTTLLDGTYAALDYLLQQAAAQLPHECLPHVARTCFSTANTGSPYFPSPLKQTEAISALKAIEAAIAASIADLKTTVPARRVNVDLERASAFLFSTYLATVDGMDKAHPKVKKHLKGTSSAALLDSLLLPRLQTTDLHVSFPQLISSRYRSSPGSVHPLSQTLCKPVRKQNPWRVFPSPWLLGSHQSPKHDRLGGPPTRPNRVPPMYQSHRRSC
jgi:hypothetical protein